MSIEDTAWSISHSIDANANPAFAWNYMTNVANWDDPPAEFKLEGPFAAGSTGTTTMPGQEPMHWRLVEVCPPQSYRLEMAMDGAVMDFEWRFAEITGGKTRITQQIGLKGANAAAFLEQVQAAFTANIEPGMARIVSAVEQAEGRGAAI